MNCILKNKFILFILLTGSIIAQNDIYNHQKYWYYKTRLNNDFVKVGKNGGESMPYNQRGLNQKGYH